eukprot:GEMP01033479.1.p1 GENE.GEMP01033479.1~~GEMP01033479.1.p1  ORF type:complete len:432 (+),score=69.59 GEMP01033479.1:86-1297(+)
MYGMFDDESEDGDEARSVRPTDNGEYPVTPIPPPPSRPPSRPPSPPPRRLLPPPVDHSAAPRDHSAPPIGLEGGLNLRTGPDTELEHPPHEQRGGKRSHKFIFLFCGWVLLLSMVAQVRPLKTEWLRAGNEASMVDNLRTYFSFIVADKSYGRSPNKRRYHDHGIFTLGHHHIRASNRTYDHWYLGFAGQFIPLPYLPRMKKDKVGFVGMCLPPGVCVANIVYSKTLEANDMVTVLLGVTIVLFVLWQWPGYWSMLFKHTTFSVSNFKHGRLHTLFLAPLSQRHWAGALHQLFALANIIGNIDSLMLIFLYFGGCFVTWFVMLLWRPHESRASYGGATGCTALFVFDCLLRPREKRSIGLMVGPSMPMATWQALLVHGVLHFGPELIPPTIWSLLLYWHWIQH